MLLICSLAAFRSANAAVSWQEDFEGDTAAWTVEGTANVWQIGVSTSGPGSAHSGSRVAGTILGGNYPDGVDARLISPEFVVPVGEKPRLRFWSWHSMYAYNTADYGQLEIRTNGVTWAPLTERMVQNSGAAWTQRIVDLSGYVGQRVQVGFHFESNLSGVAAGWYVDDLVVETGPLVFNNPEGFESGFGDWSVEGSTWQIGVPTSGPGSAHSGSRVAGTILGGDYPDGVDARLISPEFVVPIGSANPQLSFWHWFDSYESADNGRVQISTDGITWTDFTPLFSSEWTKQLFNLTAYAGQTVRLSFYFRVFWQASG